MEPAKESGAGAGLEKPTKIERDSREKVLAAFNSAYSVLENTPEDQLTPQEKLMKQKVKAAKEKSIDQGKDTFTNKFKNDKTGDIFDDQEEGIPIEGLLEFLQKRVSQVPINSKEWYDIINNAHILFRNSKGYFDLHRPAEESARWRGRLQQELEGTGRKRTDWIKATETLNNRLELVIPPAKEKARTKAKRVRASRAKIPVPAAPPEDTPPGTPVDVTPPTPAEGEPSPLPSAPPGTPPDNGEPQPTSTNQPGGNENQPQTRPSEIVFNIGSANEEVRKRGERMAQTRIEERSSEGFPTRLPKNKILRVGRLILHGLNPRNIPRILFNNSKEAYRQIWIDEHLQELRAANFGATNTLSQDAARRALAQVKEIRAAGKQVVERMKFGGIRKGEAGPTEITGPFRDYVVNQVIKPIIPRLTPLLANEAANESQIQEIENEIQRKLTDYVRGHQNDQQITSFFGRNASDYGQLSEFYASDILETARLSIENGWAQDFSEGRLDNIVKIRVFRATWGEQTEIRRTLGDRMMAWAESNRLRGRIVNPATVGALASGLTFLTIRGGLFKARAGVTVGAALVAGPLAIPLVGMASGALYAGLRNDWDLREQRVRVMREQEAGVGREVPGSGTRREIIEQSLLDMATPDQLTNGGGQEIIARAPGVERHSIQELKDTENYDALLRRYGEIYSRLDYAKLQVATKRFIFFNQMRPTGVGLVKYDEGRAKMEHGATELLRVAVDIRNLLSQKGYTPEQFRGSIDSWNNAFIRNQGEMDARFRGERLRSGLATAGGAAVIGGIIGLGFQEGIAVAGRLAGQDVGRTVIETAYQSLTGQGHAFEPTGEFMQGLYQNGGTTELGNNLAANFDPSSHTVNFINETTHQTVASGTLDAQGAVRAITVGSGTDQAASQSLAQTLSHDGFTTTMHETISSTPSLAQEITNAASQDSVKTVHLGNQLDVEIFGNSGKAVIHDLTNNTTVTGTVDHNGSFTFDQSLNNNINFSTLHDKLAQSGFGVSEAHQTGKTVIDHIFQHNPDELRKMGIIETDKVDQNWNFHVLRPDIVAATGMHTHNELTLHFGQYMNEQGQWVTDKTGLLNFGGDVNGDLIPANLPGVPAQHDAILDALIAKNGPIHHNDMVFVVQLNDNREIMLGADNLGNAQMPQELIDPRTGQFVGVKAIAAAVLEGKDGSLVRAPNLFASGALPDGTTIHSLASVAVNSPTPPPTPIDIITANPPATPGSATHFVIDALPRYPETPVIIPFPMGPREPLGPPTVPPPPPPVYGRRYGQYGQRGTRPADIPINEPDVTLPADVVLGVTPGSPIPPVRARGQRVSTSGQLPFITSIDQELSKSTAETVEALLTSDQIGEYLKVLELPNGARLQEINVKVESGNISLAGNINAAGGNSQFNAIITVDPSGAIKVVSLDIKPALQHRPFVGAIKSRVEELDKLIKDSINKGVDERWQVSGFAVKDNGLGIKFNKKPSAPENIPNLKAGMTLFISDENNSPVAPEGRAEAIENAEKVIDSEEVKASTEKGGINRGDAAFLYKEMLIWLKKENIVELEKDDSSLNPTEISVISKSLELYYGSGDNKNIVNVIAKFLKQHGFDINRGDPQLNTFVLVMIYDYVKDLPLS